LINAAGQVVGITSQIESQSGGNVGIGFAVPINTARKVAEQILTTGSVQHAWLGIRGYTLTPQLGNVLNLPVKHGAVVESVTPGSPAAKAGLHGGSATVTIGGQRLRVGGDVITSVDGKRVTSMTAVANAIEAKKPGDQVQLGISRPGHEQTLTITLGNRPANVTG